jgi:hypothetical protein
MTRNCLDPWEFCFIQTDETVRLCCYSEESVGDLTTGVNLDGVLNGQEARAYREGLLSGEMVDACRNCWARSLVPVESFRQIVTAWVQAS